MSKPNSFLRPLSNLPDVFVFCLHVESFCIFYKEWGLPPESQAHFLNMINYHWSWNCLWFLEIINIPTFIQKNQFILLIPDAVIKFFQPIHSLAFLMYTIPEEKMTVSDFFFRKQDGKKKQLLIYQPVWLISSKSHWY